MTKRTLDTAYGDIAHWQGETFNKDPLNKQDVLGKARHLVKEAKEVLADIEKLVADELPEEHAGGELVDVQFLVIDLCETLGIDLVEGLYAKLERNKQRTWDRHEDGCFHHRKGPGYVD